MRNLKSVIYTSSYDRGLEHLLKMWPDVKKEVKDAELHICYGWQLFERFYKDNPASMSWKAKMDEWMTHKGIIHHGRLPQPEIAKLMGNIGVFAYPTHFGEINCISAIKAQAYGCEPVVVDYAALKETVQYGRKVEGDIYDEETQNLFKEQLIDALTSPMTETRRKEMMEWANKKYNWLEVINDWDREFRRG